MTKAPIKYVVYSHSHFDHIAGGKPFKELGATFVAHEDMETAILNIGYADGYLRGFSARGSAFAGEFALPVLGRVSMDLIAVGCGAAPGLKEGDWVEIDYDLPSASEQSGLSQYELLTTLGARFERRWA